MACKRALEENGAELEAAGAKRQRWQAVAGACIAAGVSALKALSSPGAWRTAKLLANRDDVTVSSTEQLVEGQEGLQLLRLRGQVHLSAALVKAFPHSHADPAAAPVVVELVMDAGSGEVKDCSTSCCPGGYNAVLASFCPCATAVYLQACRGDGSAGRQACGGAADEAMPDAPAHGHHDHKQVLPAWEGSVLADVLAARHLKREQLHLLHDRPVINHLGLGEWTFGQDGTMDMGLPVKTAATRNPSYYSYSSRVNAANVDSLSLIEDARDDMDQHPMFRNVQMRTMTLPEPAKVYPAPGSASVYMHVAGAEGTGSQPESREAESPAEKALAVAARTLLCFYAGKWADGYASRPKVINDAFELLDSRTRPAQPLHAITLLCRALWEYLHDKGLCRLLSKPLKMLLALRNVLLMVDAPLYVRRSLAALLASWEQRMLRAHAEKPLDFVSQVGLVHLLRVLQEARQLSLHGWDAPALVSAVRGDMGASCASLELTSLLQLRLQLLKTMGLQQEYLHLAMGGGMWSEAVTELLASKDKSNLQQAVQLLSQRITSKPERLRHMRQLVSSEGLASVEKLEVAAKLLLDMRAELTQNKRDGQTVYRCTDEKGQEQTASYTIELGAFLRAFNQAASKSALGVQVLFSAAQESLKAQEEAAKAQADAAKAQAGAASTQGAGSNAHAEAAKAQQSGTGSTSTAAAPSGAACAHPPAGDGEAAAMRLAFIEADRVLHAGSHAVGAAAGEEVPMEVEDEVPVGVHARPPVDTRPLLSLDQRLFDARQYTNHYETPHISASIRTRSTNALGYIEDEEVLKGYDTVLPVEYPNLVPVLSLAVQSVHVLIKQMMGYVEASYFDASLPVDGLQTLQSETVIEGGGHPLRVQAALEVVVYTVLMTPPNMTGSVMDELYYNLCWQLLAMGQLDLAALVARARFKAAPSKRSAGELMEVAIACGREAQLTAVDDILGKTALQAKAAVAAEAGVVDDMGENSSSLISSDDEHGGSGGGGSGRGNGGPKRRRSSSRSNSPPHENEDAMSVDTEQLLGSAAGAADTASSRMRRHKCPPGASSAPAPAPAAAAAARPAAPDPERMRQLRVQHAQLYEVAQDIFGEAEDTGMPMSWADALEEAIAELAYDDDGLDRDELVAMMQEDEVNMGDIMGMWAPMPRRAQPLRDSPPPGDVAAGILREDHPLRQGARAGGAPGVGAGAAGRQGRAEPLQDAALADIVEDLFGLSDSKWHNTVMQALTSLGPWQVAMYAKGRGADLDVVQRLALAAWCVPDGQQAVTRAQAKDWDEWHAATVNLQYWPGTLVPGPATGYNLSGNRSWQCLPARNWDSFVNQDRYAYEQRNDSDSHLAWLLAVSRNAEGGAAVSQVLQRLTILSRTRPNGLSALQLAHALQKEGLRELACEAVRNGLLPRAAHLEKMTPSVIHVACLKELVPMVEKHGSDELRANLAATLLFLLREPLKLQQLTDEKVLGPLLRHLIKLFGQFQTKTLTPAFARRHFARTSSEAAGQRVPMDYQLTRSGDWLNDLFCRCMLGPLADPKAPGAHQAATDPKPAPAGGAGAGASDAADSAEVAAARVRFLELLCEVLHKEGLHWSFQAYAARACWAKGVTGTWSALASLVAPALSQAVQQYETEAPASARTAASTIAEWRRAQAAGEPAEPAGGAAVAAAAAAAEDRDVAQRVLEDMNAVMHGRPPAPMPAAAGAHALAAGGAAAADGGAAAPAQPAARAELSAAAKLAKEWVQYQLEWLAAELSIDTSRGTDQGAEVTAQWRDFGELVCTALHGWRGPELLPLLRIVLQRFDMSGPPVVPLLPNAVLPACGRMADLDASNNTTPWGTKEYLEALEALVNDEKSMTHLPQLLVRHICLTYWYRARTPTALMHANEVLLKREGREAAAAMALPAHYIAGLMAPTSGAGTSGTPAAPAQPKLHPVLLENLDLIPAKGGLEAAAIKFLQLQVAAGKGDLTAAIACIFDSDSTAPDSAAPAGQYRPVSNTLRDAMQMADTVLKLMDEHDAPVLNCVRESDMFLALRRAIKPIVDDESNGQRLLETVPQALRKHVLRYKIWRLAEHIVRGAPTGTERQIYGPRQQPPMAPDYLTAECIERWTIHLNTAISPATTERGLAPKHQPSELEAVKKMLAALAAEERQLAWAVEAYGREVPGDQGRRDLQGLISAEDARNIGRLPTFTAAMGARVKEDNRLFRLLSLFWTPDVPSKVRRYCQRNARDLDHFAGYLTTQTVQSLQETKKAVLPWRDWAMGTKSVQARELAEWLWYLLKGDGLPHLQVV